MMKFPFKLQTAESLIILNCLTNDEVASLALDTGASHTTLDLSFLIISGVDRMDATGSVWMETAIGPVEAKTYKVKSLTALGITRPDFEVCAYDFLSHNIFTDIDGMLGLDFFRGLDLNISFKRFEIEIG